jgi:hypothetical protein
MVLLSRMDVQVILQISQRVVEMECLGGHEETSRTICLVEEILDKLKCC